MFPVYNRNSGGNSGGAIDTTVFYKRTDRNIEFYDFMNVSWDGHPTQDGNLTTKSYVDTKTDAIIDEAKSYTDTQISSSETEMKNYTDTEIAASATALEAYTDTGIAASETEVKNYTDARILATEAYIDTELANVYKKDEDVNVPAGNKITCAAAPTDPHDVVNKSYADSLIPEPYVETISINSESYNKEDKFFHFRGVKPNTWSVNSYVRAAHHLPVFGFESSFHVMDNTTQARDTAGYGSKELIPTFNKMDNSVAHYNMPDELYDFVVPLADDGTFVNKFDPNLKVLPKNSTNSMTKSAAKYKTFVYDSMLDGKKILYIDTESNSQRCDGGLGIPDGTLTSLNIVDQKHVTACCGVMTQVTEFGNQPCKISDIFQFLHYPLYGGSSARRFLLSNDIDAHGLEINMCLGPYSPTPRNNVIVGDYYTVRNLNIVNDIIDDELDGGMQLMHVAAFNKYGYVQLTNIQIANLHIENLNQDHLLAYNPAHDQYHSAHDGTNYNATLMKRPSAFMYRAINASTFILDTSNPVFVNCKFDCFIRDCVSPELIGANVSYTFINCEMDYFSYADLSKSFSVRLINTNVKGICYTGGENIVVYTYNSFIGKPHPGKVFDTTYNVAMNENLVRQKTPDSTYTYASICEQKPVYCLEEVLWKNKEGPYNVDAYYLDGDNSEVFHSSRVYMSQRLPAQQYPNKYLANYDIANDDFLHNPIITDWSDMHTDIVPCWRTNRKYSIWICPHCHQSFDECAYGRFSGITKYTINPPRPYCGRSLEHDSMPLYIYGSPEYATADENTRTLVLNDPADAQDLLIFNEDQFAELLYTNAVLNEKSQHVYLMRDLDMSGYTFKKEHFLNINGEDTLVAFTLHGMGHRIRNLTKEGYLFFMKEAPILPSPLRFTMYDVIFEDLTLFSNTTSHPNLVSHNLSKTSAMRTLRVENCAFINCVARQTMTTNMAGVYGFLLRNMEYCKMEISGSQFVNVIVIAYGMHASILSGLPNEETSFLTGSNTHSVQYCNFIGCKVYSNVIGAAFTSAHSGLIGCNNTAEPIKFTNVCVSKCEFYNARRIGLLCYTCSNSNDVENILCYNNKVVDEFGSVTAGNVVHLKTQNFNGVQVHNDHGLTGGLYGQHSGGTSQNSNDDLDFKPACYYAGCSYKPIADRTNMYNQTYNIQKVPRMCTSSVDTGYTRCRALTMNENTTYSDHNGRAYINPIEHDALYRHVADATFPSEFTTSNNRKAAFFKSYSGGFYNSLWYTDVSTAVSAGILLCETIPCSLAFVSTDSSIFRAPVNGSPTNALDVRNGKAYTVAKTAVLPVLDSSELGITGIFETVDTVNNSNIIIIKDAGVVKAYEKSTDSYVLKGTVGSLAKREITNHLCRDNVFINGSNLIDCDSGTISQGNYIMFVKGGKTHVLKINDGTLEHVHGSGMIDADEVSSIPTCSCSDRKYIYLDNIRLNFA